MENLLDPASQAKVQRYAHWINENPATAFGVEGSYEANSQKQDLLEARKMRDKQNKIFGQGKHPADWNEFDARIKGRQK
jgi:hypothetical protein